MLCVAFAVLASVNNKCCPDPLLVLLTGFKPFDHKNDNPAGDTAALLNGKCVALDNGGCFRFDGRVVPTDHEGTRVGEILVNKRNTKYAAVIHIGELLDRSMHKIHVETNAANVQGHHSNSAKFGEPIFKDQQAFLPSTADFTTIQLNDDAIWHQDPGVICNCHYSCVDNFLLTCLSLFPVELLL